MLPVGVIVPFGGDIELFDVDNGENAWMPCDGRSLNRSAYEELYIAIGTAWGGDDRGAFNLPDLRGRFVRGVDNEAKRDPDVSLRSESSEGGNRGDSVGTVQGDATKRPNTPFQTNEKGAFNPANGNFNNLVQITGQHTVKESDSTSGEMDIEHAAPIQSIPSHSHEVSSGGDKETRPLNVSVNWLIKVR